MYSSVPAGDVHGGAVAPGKTDPGRPRLVRRSGGRIVGGVAGGIADHVGVDPLTVRIVFVLLSALAGAGIVAYAMLWVFTPSGSDERHPSGTERRQALGLVLLGFGVSVAMSAVFSGSAARILTPLIVVAVGAALVWREYDADASRTPAGPPAKPSWVTWSRIIAGVTLIVAGLAVVVLGRIDISALGSALLAVGVTLLGVGLLSVPLWLRMTHALNTERAARIRTAEREEIASHLHDSVLQTLALIQRQAKDPHEVARLARSQERELRAWLFNDTGPAHSSLAAALRAIAGEVEDQYGVRVTPVTVGDVSMIDTDATGLPQEHFTAVLGATREALVNAAKHAQVTDIDVFAETEPHQISVFIRDRGVGFDPAEIPADRHGLSHSVRARIQRRGGKVAIISAPGQGAEVRIVLPRSVSVEPEEEAPGVATEATANAGRDVHGVSVEPEEVAAGPADKASDAPATVMMTGEPSDKESIGGGASFPR